MFQRLLLLHGSSLNKSSIVIRRMFWLIFVLSVATKAEGFVHCSWKSVTTGRKTPRPLQLRNTRLASLGKDESSDRSQTENKRSEVQSRECMASTGPPFLALVTEPDACDNSSRVEDTARVVQAATSTNGVALVSVRVTKPRDVEKDEFEERVADLTRRLVVLAERHRFCVVVSSDWTNVAVKARAHGVHVKEHHRSLIPGIRQQFDQKCIIGTSAHSVASAVEAWSAHGVDYLFVGTCYATASHPDKVDLEGPTLPGEVCRVLGNMPSTKQRPVVMGIGGVEADNCQEPVLVHGADGVAIIRAVFHSNDPAKTVRLIRNNMQQR